MDFEDSRFALFQEPNAYIQKFEKQDKKDNDIKKIVFQEPYERLPNFYLNNHFTKHGCSCVSNSKHSNNTSLDDKCVNGCDEKSGCGNHHDFNSKKNGFSFDIKNLLPLLGLFGNGVGSDLTSVLGLLNGNSSNPQSGNNFNLTGLISNIMSNKDMFGGILNLFKTGGLNLFNNKQSTKKELKTTDFEISNYVRVE